MTTPLLRLQAYTGNAAARKAPGAAPGPPHGIRGFGPSFEWIDHKATAAQWLTGLIPLCLAAAPGVECDGCHDMNGVLGWHKRECTGKIPDPHALLRLAVDVADKAHGAWSPENLSFGQFRAAEAALDAVDAWLKDPSEERRVAWRNAWTRATGYDLAPLWLPYPLTCDIVSKEGRPKLDRNILASLDLIGRESLGRCAVERVSEECSGCIEWGEVTSGCALCQGTGRVERNTKESDK